IRLLFAQLRAEQRVDGAFELGAFVVGLVDRTRQRHEAFAEIAACLALADVVLDLPKRLVDRFQPREEVVETGDARCAGAERRLEKRELLAHVLELARVAQAFALDLEDRQLVGRFAERDVRGDGAHQAASSVVRRSSSRASTSSTAMSAMQRHWPRMKPSASLISQGLQSLSSTIAADVLRNGSRVAALVGANSA